MSYCIDEGVFDSLRNYLVHGLHPGSFGIALLLGDRKLAYEKAHVLLREHPTAIDDMLALTNILIPSCARGMAIFINAWMQHRGMTNVPWSPQYDQCMVELKLRGLHNWWNLPGNGSVLHAVTEASV